MQTNNRLRSVLLGLVAAPLLATCTAHSKTTQLQRVQERGELVVLTRNAATTYYEGQDGPTGIEYDLVRGFAEELGVKVRMVPIRSGAELFRRLSEDEADMAAAGLVIGRELIPGMRYAQPYQQVTRQLVYRLGTEKPKDLATLRGRLEVARNSAHADLLRSMELRNPALVWSEAEGIDDEELFSRVYDRLSDFTVAFSHEVALMRRFYPELQVGFEFGEPERLAWAIGGGEDDSLLEAANRYLARVGENGTLAQLIDRYYGHVEEFDYVGTRTFIKDIRERLPNYRHHFEQAAGRTGVDWRLLAAIGYQESHWDPTAVSPTGVKGLMMLTAATAQHLGVSRRDDARQSIDGAARYVRELLDAVPDRVEDPDRTWLALAAYNVGTGHLEDARVLAQKRGGNPDRWSAVKDTLPLLHKAQWHQQTRNGYARGKEARDFVENVRAYYDILVWLDEKEQQAISPLKVALPTL